MKKVINAGFSIIEFLIAMTLGTLIIGSIIAIYVNNRGTYMVQEGLARLQENARYAVYYLNKEIRMAGFQGCTNQQNVAFANLIPNASTVYNYTESIKGHDGGASSFSPAIPANITGTPAPNSDVLEIRMASPINSQLDVNMATQQSPVHVYSRLAIAAGMPLMITDCKVGDLFIAGAGSQSTNITHPAGSNTSDNLTITYLQDAQVMRFIYEAFYVRDSGRVNQAGQVIYALVKQNADGSIDELAEGVEAMKIIYGVDTTDDNAADSYQTAAQVEAGANWDKVISVRINLLIATPESVNDKASTYVFNGTTYNPADNKLRREWITFTTLRNRGLPS